MRTRYLATAGWANTGEFAATWGNGPDVQARYYDRARGERRSGNHHVFRVEDDGRIITAITLVMRGSEPANEPRNVAWVGTGRKIAIGGRV